MHAGNHDKLYIIVLYYIIIYLAKNMTKLFFGIEKH